MRDGCDADDDGDDDDGKRGCLDAGDWIWARDDDDDDDDERGGWMGRDGTGREWIDLVGSGPTPNGWSVSLLGDYALERCTTGNTRLFSSSSSFDRNTARVHARCVFFQTLDRLT